MVQYIHTYVIVYHMFHGYYGSSTDVNGDLSAFYFMDYRVYIALKSNAAQPYLMLLDFATYSYAFYTKRGLMAQHLTTIVSVHDLHISQAIFHEQD